MSPMLTVKPVKLSDREWRVLQQLWEENRKGRTQHTPYRAFMDVLKTRHGYEDWNAWISALDQAKPDWRGYTVTIKREVAA